MAVTPGVQGDVSDGGGSDMISVGDGSTTVSSATSLIFSGATVADGGSNEAQIAISGGGNSYIAPAVHFDGTVSFGTASLVGPSPSGLVLISVWERLAADAVLPRTIFATDGRQPGGAYASTLFIGSLVDAGVSIVDAYLSDAGSNNWIGQGAYETLSAVYHHTLVYADVNHDDPNKIFKVYIDDLDLTISPQNSGPAFEMTWNAVPFDIGSAGDETGFLVGDIADLRIIIPEAPLDTGGSLPPLIRRLFIDANGRPVDPAVATSFFGTPGMILCSGSTGAFFTNQGTGGALTASPGSAGTLTVSDRSPSE